MLIRCKKCGEVFPCEYDKCPHCGIATIKIPKADLEEAERLKKEKPAVAKRTWQRLERYALLVLLISIALFVVGMIMIKHPSYKYINAGGIIAFSSFGGLAIMFIMFGIAAKMANDYDAKIAEKLHQDKFDPVEYEQRIKCAINGGQGDNAKLIKCPGCGNSVRQSEPNCVHCGYALQSTQNATMVPQTNRTSTTARTEHKTQSNEFIPKCPTCGCPDIEKISATSKAIGVIAFGIFSSSNGKQFKCKKCGYKW